MSGQSINPLAKHFRQPILYIKLPSQGKWYPDGALELPVNGEIPIYAMTARDEITMKTPDSLLNGASTVHVIQSCCPSIQDPWKMPMVDVDSILIALRIATYGKEMEFVSMCPHCGTKHDKAIDLTVLMDKIYLGDWATPVDIDGLKITLRPLSYQEGNSASQTSFDEQRLLKIVQDEELSEEERNIKFNELFQQLIASGIEQVSKSIASVTMPTGEVVTNPKFIQEFLDNCNKHIWTAIKDQLTEIQKANKYSELNLVCENPECGKEYTAPFMFEQSNFFG